MPPEIITSRKAVARQRHVLIYRVDNMICICRDKATPLDPVEYDLVVPKMEYDHVEHLFGIEAMRTGMRVRTSRVRLYDFDDRGLNCPWGYIPTVVRAFRAAGYAVRYLDESTPRHRPGCFDLDWDRVYDGYQFRPRQEDCFWEMTEAIAQGLGGQIEAPPGFGKSSLLAPLALGYRKAQIVIVTQSRDNAEKTVDTLARHLPAIGQVGGGKHRKGRVTIVTAGSLHHIGKDEVDILVGDESHELVAPTYIEPIIEASTYARPFGMSATPEGRADGAQARLEPMFGPPIFVMKWLEAERLGLVVPITVHWSECVFDVNPAADFDARNKTARLRHGIWRNRDRNGLIADVARTVPDDEQCLILVDKIEHAVHLRQHLTEFTLCYGGMRDEDFGQYDRDDMLGDDFEPMNDKRRARLRNEFMRGDLLKVIATGVWRRAVSFDSLQHLVWAAAGSGFKDAYQGPGRVSRIDPDTGKSCAHVYDFTDDFDDGFHGQGITRQRHYRKIGWRQVLPHPRIAGRAEP